VFLNLHNLRDSVVNLFIVEAHGITPSHGYNFTASLHHIITSSLHHSIFSQLLSKLLNVNF